jgi:hypothetical protein
LEIGFVSHKKVYLVERFISHQEDRGNSRNQNVE